MDTIIGAYQFETTVLLEDFSHLREVDTLEIAVQQFHPMNPYCKYCFIIQRVLDEKVIFDRTQYLAISSSYSSTLLFLFLICEVYTYGSEAPATWYTVFMSGNQPNSKNFLRRYISHSFPYPLTSSTTTSRKRRTSSITKDEKVRITVGNNLTCAGFDPDKKLICNGPLGAGLKYRLVGILQLLQVVPL